MKKLLVVLVLLVASVAYAEETLLKGDQPVEPGQCINASYDPTQRNWLTFRNDCNLDLNVAYNWATGRGGSRTVRAGTKEATAYSEAEVNARGGYTIAVCKSGYHTVSSDGGYWKNGNQPHHCKKD